MKGKILEYSSYLAIACSIIGTIGVNQKELWGQLVYIVANLLWVNYALRKKLVPVFVLNSVFLALAISGAIAWWK